jgi:hypothetical protein
VRDCHDRPRADHKSGHGEADLELRQHRAKVRCPRRPSTRGRKIAESLKRSTTRASRTWFVTERNRQVCRDARAVAPRARRWTDGRRSDRPQRRRLVQGPPPDALAVPKRSSTPTLTTLKMILIHPAYIPRVSCGHSPDPYRAHVYRRKHRKTSMKSGKAAVLRTAPSSDRFTGSETPAGPDIRCCPSLILQMMPSLVLPTIWV